MGRCVSAVAFWLPLVISRVISPLLYLCTSFYTKGSILYPCANVSVPPYILIQRRNTLDTIIFLSSVAMGIMNLSSQVTCLQIRIYGKLEYIDTMRMTLCGIFSIKPFMIAS